MTEAILPESSGSPEASAESPGSSPPDRHSSHGGHGGHDVIAPLEPILQHILTELGDAADAEAVSRFMVVATTPETMKALEAVKAGDFDRFYFALEYPQSRVIDGLLSAYFPSEPGKSTHEIKFLFKESQFVDRHVCTLIRAIEGSPCSADKSATVMRAIANHLQTGKRISFNHDQKYTYHLPKKVFTDHEITMKYFRSLIHLHAGNPEPLIEALRAIHESLRTDQPHQRPQ